MTTSGFFSCRLKTYCKKTKRERFDRKTNSRSCAKLWLEKGREVLNAALSYFKSHDWIIHRVKVMKWCFLAAGVFHCLCFSPLFSFSSLSCGHNLIGFSPDDFLFLDTIYFLQPVTALITGTAVSLSSILWWPPVADNICPSTLPLLWEYISMWGTLWGTLDTADIWAWEAITLNLLLGLLLPLIEF